MKKISYNWDRASKKQSDCIYYKQQKKDCQKEYKKAYSSHVNILVSEDQTGNLKILYSFIKSKNCDASGVASLSTDEINHIASAKITKILNDQFTSVCTAEDTTSILKLTPADHHDVKSILVNRKGVLKLLKDINPF